MSTIYNKATGYLLLAIGLGIIFWSIYSAYEVFNGQKPAPEIFKIERREAVGSAEKTSPVSEIKNQADLQARMQGAIGNEIGAQLREILPVDFLPKLMNLVSWSVFIGILIFAGSQVSSLGIKLAKD